MAHPYAHNRRNATRAYSQHAETHHGIPSQIKRCVLETCGTSKLLAERPTSRPSKCIILSVTLVVSGQWRIHPHMHRNTPHDAYFGPAQTPLRLRTQNILTTYGTSERARISRTSEPPLADQYASDVKRCTGPEWRAHAHACMNAPHACFGHAKSVPRALCSHMVLAMAPLIARTTQFE